MFVREPVDDNPYLKKFYLDMKRWGFSMQMELLYRRFDQHWNAQYAHGNYIFDRGITGDKVFADMLHDDKLITDIEYDTYLKTHEIMVKKLQTPDLIIYLDGTPDTAFRRILKRDRDQEETLKLSYLKNMEKYYKPMFFGADRPDFIRESKMVTMDWNFDSTDDRYLAPIVRSLESEYFK